MVRLGLALAGPLLFALAGCGVGNVAANPQPGALAVTPGVSALDTNCTRGWEGGRARVYSKALVEANEEEMLKAR